jgi:RimJ/RimL family protein N-acetyltransferase
MESSLEIRQLTPPEAQTWWALRLRALREHPEAFGSSYEDAAATPVDQALENARARLGAENALTLGAWEAERLVGMVSCFRASGRKNRHKATIVSMYVAREASGRGIGRALLTETIARVSAWPGLELLQLSVVTENDRARRLYHTLGFRPYGIERHALKIGGRYYDEELLSLDLTTPPG